jgi:putative transposase
VIRALRTAAICRHLAKGAVLHSDRGVEYTSAAYRREVARIGAQQSLSRSGSCLDNAPAETFFATLKTEIGRLSWSTRQTAVHALDQWITLYNNLRLHSSIGYRAPMDARIRRRRHVAAA